MTSFHINGRSTSTMLKNIGQYYYPSQRNFLTGRHPIQISLLSSQSASTALYKAIRYIQSAEVSSYFIYFMKSYSSQKNNLLQYLNWQIYFCLNSLFLILVNLERLQYIYLRKLEIVMNLGNRISMFEKYW